MVHAPSVRALRARSPPRTPMTPRPRRPPPPATATRPVRRPAPAALGPVGRVGELAYPVEIALDGERGTLVPHPVQVRGEGLRLGVVRVEPEQLVVELGRPARTVLLGEVGHAARVAGGRAGHGEATTRGRSPPSAGWARPIPICLVGGVRPAAGAGPGRGERDVGTGRAERATRRAHRRRPARHRAPRRRRPRVPLTGLTWTNLTGPTARGPRPGRAGPAAPARDRPPLDAAPAGPARAAAHRLGRRRRRPGRRASRLRFGSVRTGPLPPVGGAAASTTAAGAGHPEPMAIIGGSAITLLAGRIRRRHTIADLESPTAELRATLPGPGIGPGAQARRRAQPPRTRPGDPRRRDGDGAGDGGATPGPPRCGPIVAAGRAVAGASRSPRSSSVRWPSPRRSSWWCSAPGPNR